MADPAPPLLRPIHRDGVQVRMQELREGDVFTIDNEPGLYVALGDAAYSRSYGTWGIDASFGEKTNPTLAKESS